MANDKKLNFNPKDWTLKFIENPFIIYKLCNVFSHENSVIELKKELSNLELTHQMTDIFSFYTTKDLLKTKQVVKLPGISEFLKFLKYFRIFLSHLFKVELEDKFSLSCSMYENKDYLLCHDDKTEDRSIAFIFYLNKSWKPEWGGSLDLFDRDEFDQPLKVVRRIYPDFNSLIFFKVGNYTYHQVAEVLTDETPRITLNGWFHSKDALKLEQLDYSEPPFLYIKTHIKEDLLSLNYIANNEFMEPEYMELIIENLRENSVMMLQNFLKTDFYEKIAQELRSPNILWHDIGPANRRKFQVADQNSMPSIIKDLVSLLQSQHFCSYIQKLSSKKLFVKKKDKELCGFVYVEAQRWKNGDYSLIVDDDCYYKTSSVDIFLFFNVEKDSDLESDENGNQPGNICYYEKFSTTNKCEIEPQDNSICLALKNENETKYISYINEKSLINYNVLFISFKI